MLRLRFRESHDVTQTGAKPARNESTLASLQVQHRWCRQSRNFSMPIPRSATGTFQEGKTGLCLRALPLLPVSV